MGSHLPINILFINQIPHLPEIKKSRVPGEVSDEFMCVSPWCFLQDRWMEFTFIIAHLPTIAYVTAIYRTCLFPLSPRVRYSACKRSQQRSAVGASCRRSRTCN